MNSAGAAGTLELINDPSIWPWKYYKKFGVDQNPYLCGGYIEINQFNFYNGEKPESYSIPEIISCYGKYEIPTEFL